MKDVEQVFRETVERMGHGVVHIIDDHAAFTDDHVRSISIAASAFSIGIELGLGIAVADIVAGRRLQQWYDGLRGDLAGTENSNREQAVDEFLRALSR